MKIFLTQLSTLDTDFDFTQDEAWVSSAVHRVDEHLEESPITSPSKEAARPVQVHFTMRMVDEVAVVDGNIDTYVELVCSRCAATYKHECHPQFSALFCKDPAMAGVAHTEGDKLMGQNKGFARHAHDAASDAAIESGQDLDITYLAHDFIDLADVLTEQLQLQVPFQPLCKEGCKGMCTNCGADLNVGRCACAKVSPTNAFSVLRDFKTLNKQ